MPRPKKPGPKRPRKQLRTDPERDRDGAYRPTTVRLSEVERRKLSALCQAYGVAGHSAVLRTLIDRAHDLLPRVL